MSKPIRWGILGCGSIARKFATGLAALDDAELTVVGSRSLEKARAFAAEFKAQRAHGSYADLAADPQLDVVYVATPHPMHRDPSILCLEAGKAVLCEKPFAVNAADARAVVQVARSRGLFLMEAMWTRFLPVMGQVREWLAAGVIGEPRLVTGDFGFRAGVDPQARLFNPELAGGALLDVGIYPISFACMVLGTQPRDVASLASLGDTGVDEQAGIVLRYENGALAVATTTIRTTTPQEARILGTDGMILLDPPFWKGERAVLRTGDRQEAVDLPLEGNGYNYEAAEVGRSLRTGRTESSILPLDDTVAIIEVLDRIRAQWGLKYPME